MAALLQDIPFFQYHPKDLQICPHLPPHNELPFFMEELKAHLTLFIFFSTLNKVYHFSVYSFVFIVMPSLP